MPLETLKTLQDLEITGATGSQQDETHHHNEPIESDGQEPTQTLHPTIAPHPAALQADPSEQPHPTPFYPPLFNHFAFDSGGTVPIDPGLLDDRFDHSAASGPGGGCVPGFHHGHWPLQPVSSVNMDGFMVTSTSLLQYNSSAPLQPGMSSFEPLISTTWSMDGSLPSASTSRGPTMSSSMSVPSTSTPASSKSPSSPAKVGAAMIESPAAGKDVSLANYSGMQLEPRAEEQPNKKRRQTSGAMATQKTNTEKRNHRNNSSPGFSTPQVPIASAPIAVASTSDENKKNVNKKKGSISSSNQDETTTTTTPTTTTSNASSGPSQPGSSTQAATTIPGQPADPRARNREAANRCRAKSKVAVAELEATERAMSSEHQALTQTARHLRDEVLSLKNELLMHGNCDDDLIQQYLANSARMVGSGVVGAAATTTTTTTAGGLPGLSLQAPSSGTMPPGGPSLAGPLGGAGSMGSSRAMLSASPPRMLPAIVPSSSSAPGAGTTISRGKGGVGRRKP